MALLLVAATLTATPETTTPTPHASWQAMAADLGPRVQTGTLLLSDGDCVAVKVFSQSRYTHVATVVRRHGKPFVYDSAHGVGVRCQTLANYLKSRQPDELHVLRPAQSFSEARTAVFVEHLDSQLGRPYAVQHYLTSKRADGVHCAEYVTDALCACRLIRAKHPSHVSPGSLAEGVLEHELYVEAAVLTLNVPEAPPEQGDNWCEQLWIDTKTCTKHCCTRMKGWFLCR